VRPEEFGKKNTGGGKGSSVPNKLRCPKRVEIVQKTEGHVQVPLKKDPALPKLRGGREKGVLSEKGEKNRPRRVGFIGVKRTTDSVLVTGEMGSPKKGAKRARRGRTQREAREKTIAGGGWRIAENW